MGKREKGSRCCVGKIGGVGLDAKGNYKLLGMEFWAVSLFLPFLLQTAAHPSDGWSELR